MSPNNSQQYSLADAQRGVAESKPRVDLSMGMTSIEIPWENVMFQGCMSPTDSQQYNLADAQRGVAESEPGFDLSMGETIIETS